MEVTSTAQRTIGKYHVVTKIADGALAKVYKGFNPATGAAVAIKLATSALVRDKVLLQRFEQEFRSTSNLRHANIVRALDFGWEGPKPYIVMEFVEGEDMYSRIERQGKLSEAEAINFIIQVANGLHEAHKNSIIHRDIKPDNILLTADGQAKLADLGLSKDLEGNIELTRPDRGLGTPNFIAPEQFGDARNATVRCDIYSLGATLYMALTGQLPFAGGNLATILKQKLANDLPAPRKLVPKLSEHVDWAVRRAILADADRRFATCLEFIAALTEGGEGPQVGLVGKRASLARPPKRKTTRPERERRASLRFDCDLPTSCSINASLHDDATETETEWEVQVCNLSVEGVALLISRRFEPGSVLTVVLKNRDGDGKQTRKIRVVRIERADGAGWFLAGTFAEKLSKEELRQLL